MIYEDVVYTSSILHHRSLTLEEYPYCQITEHLELPCSKGTMHRVYHCHKHLSTCNITVI